MSNTRCPAMWGRCRCDKEIGHDGTHYHDIAPIWRGVFSGIAWGTWR